MVRRQGLSGHSAPLNSVGARLQSFDDLVKSPVKEGAAKSPVQARLEAQAMMAEADPENLTSKLAGAAIRKEKMMGAKAATLAKNNLRVETTSDAVKHKQEEMLAAKAEQTETRCSGPALRGV
jgi:outer membrane protein W